MRNFPEFLGYKAASFPEQLPPRQIKYEPRRMDLPPGFEHDWKKIKTRRKTIIIVEEATEKGNKGYENHLERVSNSLPNVEV